MNESSNVMATQTEARDDRIKTENNTLVLDATFDTRGLSAYGSYSAMDVIMLTIPKSLAWVWVCDVDTELQIAQMKHC